MKRALRSVCAKDIYLLTAQEYLHDVLQQCPQIAKENVILEVAAKNTAPALALALVYLQEQKISQDEVIALLPSDHIIAPEERFGEVLQRAEQRALQGNIVTFGVRPDRPETGYGYIKARGEEVLAFVEKPDRKRAQEYLVSGEYFWNSGMFAFTVKTMVAEMKRHAPLIAKLFEGDFKQGCALFPSLERVSLDYAVMEKSSRIAMLPLDLTWSDVGSWDHLYDLLEKDGAGNALSGSVVPLGTQNSLIFSDKPLVATIGVEDVIVVATDDVVLIAHRGEGQRVKEMVEQLKNRAEVESHKTAYRPWGSYTVLEEGVRYKIKRISVKSKEKLSLQLHYHRSEHWIVVSGTARVTINGMEKIVHEGESLFVPKSAIHRVENPGLVPLEIIEVQVGEYLGEDDIVRLEDIYGRLKEGAAFEVLLAREKVGNSLTEE